MKHIEINIGLLTTGGHRVNLALAHSLVAHACSIVDSAIHHGEWEGKPEQTLVIQALIDEDDRYVFERQLASVSKLLSQDCIAVFYGDDGGALIGPNTKGFTFDPDYFQSFAKAIA